MREYVSEMRKRNAHTKEASLRHPTAYKYLAQILKSIDTFQRFEQLVNPYLIAIISVVVAIRVFIRIMKPYIP